MASPIGSHADINNALYLSSANHQLSSAKYPNGKSNEEEIGRVGPTSFLASAATPGETSQAPSSGKRRLDAYDDSGKELKTVRKRCRLATKRGLARGLPRQTPTVNPNNPISNNGRDAIDVNDSNRAAAARLRKGLRDPYSHKDSKEELAEQGREIMILDTCSPSVEFSQHAMDEKDGGGRDGDSAYGNDHEDETELGYFSKLLHGDDDLDMNLASDKDIFPNGHDGFQQQHQEKKGDFGPEPIAEFSPIYSERYIKHFNTSLSPKDRQIVHLLLKFEKYAAWTEWRIFKNVRYPTHSGTPICLNAYRLEVLRAVAKGSDTFVAEKIYHAVPMLKTWTFLPGQTGKTAWNLPEGNGSFLIDYRYPHIAKSAGRRGTGGENETEAQRVQSEAAAKYDAEILTKWYEVTGRKQCVTRRHRRKNKAAKPEIALEPEIAPEPEMEIEPEAEAETAPEPKQQEPQVSHEDLGERDHESCQVDYKTRWETANALISVRNSAFQEQNMYIDILLQETATAKEDLREKEKQMQTLELHIADLKNRYEGQDGYVTELLAKNQTLHDNLNQVQDQQDQNDIKTQRLEAKVGELENYVKECEGKLAIISSLSNTRL